MDLVCLTMIIFVREYCKLKLIDFDLQFSATIRQFWMFAEIDEISAIIRSTNAY